jgi:hypothetical protein
MIDAFSGPIIGVIWYMIAYFVRKAQGLDITQAFREIPPE